MAQFLLAGGWLAALMGAAPVLVVRLDGLNTLGGVVFVGCGLIACGMTAVLLGDTRLPPTRRDLTERILLAAAAMVLYVLACASEVCQFAPVQGQPIRGMEVLLSGWLGPVMGFFAWYANPLFLIALVLFLIRAGRDKRGQNYL